MKLVSKRSLWALALIIVAVLALTACGEEEQAGPEGNMTLLNEQGQEVALTNKERATILFHFTEVG
ncbi:hypothetical protein [Halalkalibacterium ligniniphilum]|uniref:hypothetical protein n=1 Tax=Halalkalibacterium ligniniphilum TaxID=1134413 RepID=UPI000344E2BF|nr:hypothetical protein [Halalkalibacterium ligniniphilum]